MSKKLLMALACSVLLMGLAACGSNDKASTSEEPKQETKKEDEQKQAEEQKKLEEQKKAEEQKQAEEQKKAEEQKRLDEQRKQEEAQRQQEEQKKQQEAARAKEQEQQKAAANTAPQQQVALKQEKVHFANCTDANNAGYYDITPDSPAYASHLDRDGDGVACERNKGHKKSSKKH
ncbi:excalibur calcium-binding domain-containing protein [Bacillus mycoides]|uniref:excalibur calcium-binding domain-containing protein n=1 Tax=Bacillus mycoides TaxID=1405 RepID=UPI003D1F7EB0